MDRRQPCRQTQYTTSCNPWYTVEVTTIDVPARTRQRLTSGGFLWGPRRVALGKSLRELEAASGVYRGFISRMENGVMIPTGEEFDRVMRVIEGWEHPEVT